MTFYELLCPSPRDTRVTHPLASSPAAQPLVTLQPISGSVTASAGMSDQGDWELRLDFQGGTMGTDDRAELLLDGVQYIMILQWDWPDSKNGCLERKAHSKDCGC
jgi:hypothetical protein